MKKIAVGGALLAVVLAGASVFAETGQELYQKKMCGACHGPGGKRGGDLANSKLDKGAIAKLLKDPKAVNPKATMPAVKGSDADYGALADYVLTLRK